MRIRLELRRQHVKDSPVRCKLVCCCIGRKIILQLNYVLWSQHLAVEITTSAGLGCSISQKDVLIHNHLSHGLYWQTEEVLQFFLIFRAHTDRPSLSGGTGLLSLRTCLFSLCSLWITCSKKAKNPQSLMIQQHWRFSVYWSDTGRSLSTSQMCLKSFFLMDLCFY